MKNKSWLFIYFLSIIGLSLILPNSCKKDNDNESPSNTITDIDGNVYHTVTIGTQVWLVENLKTTRYNDGSAIPLETEASSWAVLITPAYCWYNNDINNKNTYGALYNWYVVNTGKLAPAGWHVPTDAEWEILENYLIANGYNYDGSASGNKIAKSLASATGWQASDVVGAPGNNDYPTYVNKSGFTAVPAGYRNLEGLFVRRGYSGDTWSASDYNTDQAWQWDIDNDFNSTSREPYYKKVGFAVRCLKD